MTARHTYLADATKLEVVDGDGWGYDYLGSLVYRKNDDDTYTLESTAFACGRIVRNSSGSYRINGFVTDHLGSIRTVYDVETGDIIERNDYYPFGKRLNNSLAMSPTNRYRFSGKVARGSQRTFLCSRPEQQGFSPPVQQVVADINLLDFGARMYDDEICRWTTVDPLAEKYYSMTPYNYCANNPIVNIDPDGRVIVFADNCTEEFKEKFKQAVEYMNSCGTSYNLYKLQKSKEVYTIQEGLESYDKGHISKSGNSYSTSTKTIYWNPNIVSLDMTTGLMRSPVTALAHEAGHAHNHDVAIQNGTENEFLEGCKQGSDSQYDTKDDKMVITKTEQYAARHHGEISMYQTTRTEHGNGKAFLSIRLAGTENYFSKFSQRKISNIVTQYNKKGKIYKK